MGLFKIMSSFIRQISNSGEIFYSQLSIFSIGLDFIFFSKQQIPTLILIELGVSDSKSDTFCCFKS